MKNIGREIMSSVFWYYCLAAIGVGSAAVVICTRRHVYRISKLIVFYLFATGITWTGEFIALGLFNGYAYKPGVFPDQWAENLTAHLLLNSTIWPAAATLMSAYSLEYGWIPVITAFFILAEYLFVRLGIYEQHWWQYYMSAIVVVVFLVVTKKWFDKMNRAPGGLARLVMFYFGGDVIIHFPVPLLLLYGKEYYQIRLLEDITGSLYRSSTIFIFNYQLVEAALLVFFACILKKWYWKLMPFVVSIVGRIILVKMNILDFGDGWNLFYTILTNGVCLAAFILLHQYTLKAGERDP